MVELARIRFTFLISATRKLDKSMNHPFSAGCTGCGCPRDRTKCHGHCNCHSFLPGDAFHITVQKGEYQTELLEISEENARQENITQKITLLSVFCIRQHVH
jgi:hypothetical protein